MKLISEEAHDIEFLTEATKDGNKNYFIEGVFMQAEKKNRNGESILASLREAKRYSENLSTKKELLENWGIQMGQQSIWKSFPHDRRTGRS